MVALGLAACAAISLGVARAKNAEPAVDRATLFVGTVERGTMVRDIKAPGVLTPKHVRFVTADAPGRVERIHLRAGAQVEEGALLLELANPEIALHALQAEREVAAGEAALLEKRGRLEGQALAARDAVATLRSQWLDATRRADATRGDDGQVFSALDAKQMLGRADELATRLKLAEDRAALTARSMEDETAAERARAHKDRLVAAFRKTQLESLRVRAGGAGVLQEMQVELGQWVTPGTVLAKIVRPDELKAVVRVAEALARDVMIGQRARVDTRNGIAAGRVARVATAARQGTVDVEIALEGALPRGARPDLTVESVIAIEELPDVLSVPRPVGCTAESSATVFVLSEEGDSAVRVNARLGKESASAIEVKQGLKKGDRVILSDMLRWATVDRVRIR